MVAWMDIPMVDGKDYSMVDVMAASMDSEMVAW